MNILAIDTATEHISVSLYYNDNLTSVAHLGDAKSSSLILPMITKLLGEISLSTLDGIVYGKGPGAFTGVRVGISVVQGLALAHGIPTLGFSSLESLEYLAAKEFNTTNIISAIDARMGEVYLRYNTRELLLKPEDVMPILGDMSEYVGVGTGFDTYDNFAGCNAICRGRYPHSKALIDLALGRPEFSTELASPLYLRNNVAKKSVKF